MFKVKTNIPHQDNGNNCGVFTLAFIEHCVFRRPVNFTQADIAYYRSKIVVDIFKRCWKTNTYKDLIYRNFLMRCRNITNYVHVNIGSLFCIFVVTLLEVFWTIVSQPLSCEYTMVVRTVTNLGCWTIFLDSWKWVVNSECVKWICIFDLSIVSSFMPLCILPLETWFCMLMLLEVGGPHG